MVSSKNVNAGRPGAANSAADAESGSEGLADAAAAEKDLFALNVMRDRGLMDEETYRRRYLAIMGKLPDSD